MENQKKYIYLNEEELKGKKAGDFASYSQMIDKYCDNLILNNSIMETAAKNDLYFELYSGSDYDEENDYYIDIYQYYIISEADAERLAENTNEIIYYNDDLDIYLLGVSHFGTLWSIVDTDLKIVTDWAEYRKLTSEE